MFMLYVFLLQTLLVDSSSVGVRAALLPQLGCCKVIVATAEAAPPTEDQDEAGVSKAEADDDQRGLADGPAATLNYGTSTVDWIMNLCTPCAGNEMTGLK